jgi:hypothetical protein
MIRILLFFLALAATVAADALRIEKTENNCSGWK